MSNLTIIVSFIPTWLVFTSACISPGPNTFVVMSVALSSGRVSALLVTLGLAIGGFIWPFVSLMGVSQLLMQNPSLIKWIALIGGCYLQYSGIKTLLSIIKSHGSVPGVLPESEINQSSLRGSLAIRQGLITTLSNPKVAMVWISLSTVIPVTSEQSGWIFFYSIVIGLIVFSVYATIACIFSNQRARAGYFKKSNLINSLFSAIFIFLGGFIIFREFG